MPDWLIFCLHSFHDRELHVPNLTSFVNSFTSTSFTNAQFRFSFLTFTSRKLRGNNRTFLGYLFFSFLCSFSKYFFSFSIYSLKILLPLLLQILTKPRHLLKIVDKFCLALISSGSQKIYEELINIAILTDSKEGKNYYSFIVDQ